MLVHRPFTAASVGTETTQTTSWQQIVLPHRRPASSLSCALPVAINKSFPLQAVRFTNTNTTAAAATVLSNAVFGSRALATTTTTVSEEEAKKRLEEFQDLFVEARYCIEDCQDAAETTYFDEEAEAAKEAVAAAGKCSRMQGTRTRHLRMSMHP